MAAYTRSERWRPRRGKPAGYRSQQTITSTDPALFLKDLEEQLVSFSIDTISHASELVRPCQVKPVASYSWVDASVPTIVVPGSPWIWADECPPVRQVPFDAGVQYIHHDASKMGNRSPLLPLFAAVDALHDDFPYKDLDLVIERNGLRRLLRYIENADIDENFRIDVDLVGKTCLFTRWEENTTLVGQRTGCGYEYLRAATKAPAGCEKLLEHHRIITYNFGSLRILLGSTVDACIAPKDEEDPLTSFSSLNIGDKADKAFRPGKSIPAGLDIKFTSSRALVPQSDLVEVKTRAIYREPDWKDIYPQLCLSQIPWLYMARHERGNFQRVEKISLVGKEMEPYAEMMEASLGKLTLLLKDILKAVHEKGEDVPLSLVRRGKTLSLWRRRPGSGKPLGEEITFKLKTKA